VKSIYLKNLLKRIASHKNITNKINQLRKHRKQNTKGWNHIKKTLMTKKNPSCSPPWNMSCPKTPKYYSLFCNCNRHTHMYCLICWLNCWGDMIKISVVVFLVTWAREGGALESSKEQQLEEKMWVWWLMMGRALESSKEQQLEEKMWVWWLMMGRALESSKE
jgi:hypothetical protein